MSLALIACLFLAACAAPGGDAQGIYTGTFVLEGRHVVEAGETLPGALFVLDGQVELEPGARLAGPAYLLGGAFEVGGEALGDISVFGGRLVARPEARVGGDVRVGGGELDLSPQAEVQGQVLTGAASGLEPGDLFPSRSLENELAWLLPEALLLACLAYLAARWIPVPLHRVSRAATRHPLVSVAMGLLAGVVGLVLLVVMAYTLILIPVTLIGFIAGFLAIGYGFTGIGLALGRWLRDWRDLDLSPGALAFLGTLVFMLAQNLVSLLPYIGSLIGLAFSAIALGAVVLTRFGLREFVPSYSDQDRTRV